MLNSPVVTYSAPVEEIYIRSLDTKTAGRFTFESFACKAKLKLKARLGIVSVAAPKNKF